MALMDFLVGCANDVIVLWDLRSNSGKKWHCRALLEGHDNSIVDVTFSRDGDLLISCSRDDTLRAWDVARGTCTPLLLSLALPLPPSPRSLLCLHMPTYAIVGAMCRRTTCGAQRASACGRLVRALSLW